MSLAQIIDRLTLISRRHARDFAAGQSRQPAFAQFRDADALLAAMRGGQLPEEARSEVVIALLDEHQRRPHALWQALLTAVFRPMLLGLRTRLSTTRSEDEDQDVLVAFYAALPMLPPAGTLEVPWLAVRRLVARQLFLPLRATTKSEKAEVTILGGPPAPVDPYHAAIVDALVDLHRGAVAVAPPSLQSSDPLSNSN